MKKRKEEILKRIKSDTVKFSTVSGVFTTKPELIRLVDRTMPEIEVITTKSYQVLPNEGYREPVIVEPDVGCYGNAVGLRNPGMEQGLVELTTILPLRAILAISLSANSIEDFIRLVLHFQDTANIIELNFSCPHAAAGYGASIGSDRDLVFNYIRAIRECTDRLLFPKLTPNVDNIGEIAAAAVEAGADGICGINTVGPQRFTEKHTGEPVLNNPKGQKGGRSGKWILDTAERKIREIRAAVGPNLPVIGMGGVSSGNDARRLIQAGADVVGLGSVFARVKPEDRPAFLKAMKSDTEQLNTVFPAGHIPKTDTAELYLEEKRLAEYKPYVLKKITEVDPDTRIFELDGNLEYHSSQFAFIWLPGIGEKPFSIAGTNPVTFIIKKKGEVTESLFRLSSGDRLMIRGVYGAPAPDCNAEHACIVTGGTGLAVAPKLAAQLHDQCKKVRVFFGVTDAAGTSLDEELKAGYAPISDEIMKWGEFIPVADRGKPARVLSELAWRLGTYGAEKTAFYNIGHPNFMKKAARLQLEIGASKDMIFLSIETNTMCGIGLCGECRCGEKLTCKDGTFFSLAYLDENGIDPEAVSSHTGGKTEKPAETTAAFVPAGDTVSSLSLEAEWG